MKRLGWFILIIFCVFIALIFWYVQNDIEQHVILRLPSGFFPKVVQVDENESLRFINLTLRPIWPAAGPHPSHITYSDFDSLKGIAPLHTWVFTFLKKGTYTFHDHYAPEMNGIVVSGSNDISKVTDQTTCTILSDSLEQASCMEIYFRNVSSELPYDQARELFNDLSNSYQRSCHTFAHDLGKNAYTAHLESSLVDLGQETVSCGNGFWHGFTTAMQAHSGIEAAKEFCASLNGKTDALQDDNRMNCYHGIGIGLIPDPPPPHLWGEFQLLVDPAVAFCETVQGNPLYRERCMTGVFHAMTDYMLNELYGFAFDDDSIILCAEQVKIYQKDCFVTLIAALPASTDFDLTRTVSIIQKSTPPYLFSDIFFHAAILFVQAEAPIEEIGNFVESCGVQNDSLRLPCISAVINKLYNNGIPGIEYQKAVLFCSSAWIQTEEEIKCFQEVVSHAQSVYPPKKIVEVCNTIPKIYHPHIQECTTLLQ